MRHVVLTSVRIIFSDNHWFFRFKMKKYMSVYQANPVDYEATIMRARELGIKVELGGGRKTKSGESPNAQIIFNLKNIRSKIVISRKGKILIYYPSRPNLKKCFEILERCYVPTNGNLFDLTCEGPVDPLDQAFEFTIRVNWKGQGITYVEAKTHLFQWFDPATGEYIFQLPDHEDRVVHPGDGYIYQGCCPVKIIAIDKDDKNGNRIVTAGKLVWKGIQELKRITREHPRFKP